MQLPHDSHNPTGDESILLIHGGFSTGEEWDGVWPLLATQGYHLIVPDLRGHGAAVDRVAHVVTMSIGAHVAAALASQYPGRVRSLGNIGGKGKVHCAGPT
jgi:pimeloyl-ACP methyl ester carboxylesterase